MAGYLSERHNPGRCFAANALATTGLSRADVGSTAAGRSAGRTREARSLRYTAKRQPAGMDARASLWSTRSPPFFVNNHNRCLPNQVEVTVEHDTIERHNTLTTTAETN